MRRLTNTLVRTFTPLLSLFALGRDAGADVRVVNGTVGSGAPYTTIQAAVNAAVDGDVILVKPIASPPYYYAGFTISNKELTVVGDSPSGVQVNHTDYGPTPVVVQNVTATRTVVLANLNMILPRSCASGKTLYAFGIGGQLRVQNCTITGNAGWWCEDPLDPSGYGLGSPGGTAVWIESCAGGVAFEACTITGGLGGMVGGTGAAHGGNGGNGVQAIGAGVVLYDCTLRGGRGGDGSYYGGHGGHGMVSRVGAYTSFLVASNTSFQGGNGGIAEDLGTFYYGPGGNGGHGLWIDTGSSARRLACTFVGGTGGYSTNTPGLPGQVILNNGALFTFPVSKVVMSAPALVRAQTQMSFTFTGDPGDEIFLFHSDDTSFIGRVSWRGFLLALPMGLYRELSPSAFATIPAGGQVTVSVSAPQLQSLQQGNTVYYQAFRKTPGGSKTLGSFAAVTVVAPGF